MTSFRGFDAEALTVYAREASHILGADHWHVVEGFRYYVGWKGNVAWVDIPEGFLTDGASVPRIFWGLIPPWGKYGAAAIVHDYLCEFLQMQVNGQAVNISRKTADKIFCEAMEVLEVPWWPREPMHAAVSSYRMLANVEAPTSIPLRRQLEVDWRNKRTQKWPHSTN